MADEISQIELHNFVDGNPDEAKRLFGEHIAKKEEAVKDSSIKGNKQLQGIVILAILAVIGALFLGRSMGHNHTAATGAVTPVEVAVPADEGTRSAPVEANTPAGAPSEGTSSNVSSNEETSRRNVFPVAPGSGTAGGTTYANAADGGASAPAGGSAEVAADRCDISIPENSMALSPKDCRVSGDVKYIISEDRPSSDDSGWKTLYDNDQTTGLVVDVQSDNVWILAPYGASINDASVDWNVNDQDELGCGLDNGCSSSKTVTV